MIHGIAKALAASVVLCLAAGCVSPKEFKALGARVNALDGEVRRVKGQLTTADKRNQALQADAARAQARIDEIESAASEQAKKLEQQIKDISERFKVVSASLEEAHGILVKSLENTRSIYLAQYRAMTELIETLQKPAPPKEE